MISPGTIFGIIAGFGLFISAVMLGTDNYLMFFNLPSILMVLGGTVASSLIAYRFIYVRRAIGSFFRIFLHDGAGWKDLNDNVKMLLLWSRDVKTKGLGVLDEHLESTARMHPFTRYALESVSAGYKGDVLRDLLADYNDNQLVRQNVQVDVLQTMGGFAPAFGMIGTLVGLVIMLDGMGNDPAKLGAGLAVALLTTLYGVLLANLIFKPAALKVKQNNEILHYQNSIITEVCLLLAQRAEPMIVQDKVNSFLDMTRKMDVLKDAA